MKKIEYTGLQISQSEDKQLELDQSKKDEADLPNFSKCVPVSARKSEHGNNITKEYKWKKSDSTSIHIKKITYRKSEDLSHLYRADARDGSDSISLHHNNVVLILRKTTKEIAKALYSTYSSAKGSLENVVGWISTVLGNYYVVSMVDRLSWSFDKRISRNNHLNYIETESLDEEEKKNLCELIITNLASMHSKGVVLGRFTLNSVLLHNEGITFTDLRGLRNCRRCSYGVEEFKSLMQYLFALGIVDDGDRYYCAASYHAANEKACSEWFKEKTGKIAKEPVEITNYLEKEIF